MSFPNISLAPALGTIQNPGWDMFLIILFFTCVVIYSFFANRERLALVLLSVYTSLALSLATPVLNTLFLFVKKSELLQYRLGIFIVLFLVLYLLFSHKFSFRSNLGHSWIQGLILSIMQVGLFMSSVLSFIPRSVFSSALAERFFTGDTAYSCWLLAPIIVMIFMPRRDG